MKGGRVEISTVWPSQCLHFRVNAHLTKQSRIMLRKSDSIRNDPSHVHEQRCVTLQRPQFMP